MAVALAPKSSRRSGIEHDDHPEAHGGEGHRPYAWRIRGSVIAVRTICSAGGRNDGRARQAGKRDHQADGQCDERRKTTARPISSASAPSTGPPSEPAMAAPMAVPIASARVLAAPRHDPGEAAGPDRCGAEALQRPCDRQDVADSAQPKTRLDPASITIP